MSDDRNKSMGDEYQGISASDLEYILDVNKKSVELNIAVQQQNEEVLDKLDLLTEEINKMKIQMMQSNFASEECAKSLSEVRTDLKSELRPKVEHIKENLFRLIVILSLVGAATIFQVVSIIFHK